jgi:hypothetical protein
MLMQARNRRGTHAGFWWGNLTETDLFGRDTWM